MISKSITNLFLLAVALLVSACASNIPPEIETPVAGSPSVDQVRNNLEAYKMKKVRWGGTILETVNKQDASWLKIIALPLHENGEPRDTDQSTGRFIGLVDTFLEPKLFTADRRITITGHVLRYETLKVGEFSYDYPVIQVEHYYLWPIKVEPQYNDYPPYWWHDPFYPWPYPYYPRYPHRH